MYIKMITEMREKKRRKEVEKETERVEKMSGFFLIIRWRKKQKKNPFHLT